jgi:hypothetical protein
MHCLGGRVAFLKSCRICFIEQNKNMQFFLLKKQG